MNLTEADLATLDKFGAFFSQHAKMNLSVDDVIACHGLLVAYNGLRKKVFEGLKEAKVAEPPKVTKGK